MLQDSSGGKCDGQQKSNAAKCNEVFRRQAHKVGVINTAQIEKLLNNANGYT